VLRDSSKVNRHSEEIVHEKYLQVGETSDQRLAWPTRQIRERTRDEMSAELTFRPRVGAQGYEAEAAARADSQPRGRANASGSNASGSASASRSRSFSASRGTRTQSTPPMRFSGGGGTAKYQRRDSATKYMMQGSADSLSAPARARTPTITRYHNGSRGGHGGGEQRGVAEDDMASLHSEHSTLFELAEDALEDRDRDSYGHGHRNEYRNGHAYGSQDEANNRMSLSSASSSSSPFRQQQQHQQQQQQHHDDTTFYDKSTRWEVSSVLSHKPLSLCFAS
jgi:hypothetical protein